MTTQTKLGLAAAIGALALMPLAVLAQPPARAPAPTRQAQPPSPQMLANVTITRDIIYGHKAGMALTYDVFKPKNANGTAVINMISGAWYSTWTEPQNRLRGYQPLLEKGITVVAMHHGSAPNFKVPDAAADIQQGVKHFRANAPSYGVDPARIGAWGSSAGGHLSLVAGMQMEPGTIKTVVAYFPPTNMSFFIRPAGVPTPVRSPAPARAGARGGMGGGLYYNPALAPTISPALFVDAKDPPVLLVTGDADRTVNIRHSHVLKEAMDKAGVQNELIVFPGADHGWRHPDAAKTAEYSARAREAMVDWFVRRL